MLFADDAMREAILRGVDVYCCETGAARSLACRPTTTPIAISAHRLLCGQVQYDVHEFMSSFGGRLGCRRGYLHHATLEKHSP